MDLFLYKSNPHFFNRGVSLLLLVVCAVNNRHYHWNRIYNSIDVSALVVLRNRFPNWLWMRLFIWGNWCNVTSPIIAFFFPKFLVHLNFKYFSSEKDYKPCPEGGLCSGGACGGGACGGGCGVSCSSCCQPP